MTFKLTAGKNNQKVRLIKIIGGYGAYQRLLDMGLIPGVRFEIVLNNGFGPITISLKGTKIMLGRGLADKVLIKEENHSE
jgi:Fe2+ transport system protein FeoA